MGKSEIGWGDGGCMDFDSSFSQTVSSARFVGYQNGYQFESLTFYQYDNYGGEEKSTSMDLLHENPKIGQFGKSVIVTGCDAWTVYE